MTRIAMWLRKWQARLAWLVFRAPDPSTISPRHAIDRAAWRPNAESDKAHGVT